MPPSSEIVQYLLASGWFLWCASKWMVNCCIFTFFNKQRQNPLKYHVLQTPYRWQSLLLATKSCVDGNISIHKFSHCSLCTKTFFREAVLSHSFLNTAFTLKGQINIAIFKYIFSVATTAAACHRRKVQQVWSLLRFSYLTHFLRFITLLGTLPWAHWVTFMWLNKIFKLVQNASLSLTKNLMLNHTSCTGHGWGLTDNCTWSSSLRTPSATRDLTTEGCVSSVR